MMKRDKAGKKLCELQAKPAKEIRTENSRPPK